MAEELDAFPTTQRTTKYPWENWTNGRVWKLRQGEDYDAATRSMRTFAHTKAAQLDKKVRTKIVADEDGTECLIVQFLDK